jgi:hypothetical protein
VSLGRRPSDGAMPQARAIALGVLQVKRKG